MSQEEEQQEEDHFFYCDKESFKTDISETEDMTLEIDDDDDDDDDDLTESDDDDDDLEDDLYRHIADPSSVGSEVGSDVGIDDAVGDRKMGEKEGPKPEATTPLIPNPTDDDPNSLIQFLGLHRDTMSSLDSFENLEESTVEEDLQDTFMHMEYRKVLRLTSGRFREDPRSWIWGSLYTLVMVIYLIVKYITYEECDYASDGRPKPKHWWNDEEKQNLAKEVVLVLLLGICFVSVTDNFQLLATSLTVFALYILVVLFFLVGDSVQCPDLCSDGFCDDEPGGTEFLLFFLWLIAVSVVWAAHFFYYYVAPFIVEHTRMCFGWRRLRSVTIPTMNTRMMTDGEAESDPRITFSSSSSSSPSPMFSRRSRTRSSKRRSGSRSSRMMDRNSMIDSYFTQTKDKSVREVVFQYRPLAKRCGFFCWSVSKHTFLYRGSMRKGRPHGWGQWRDDSFHGESLAGYWRDGIPIGPFNSCEKGTGNMFSAVIVGFCSMRTDAWTCLPQDEVNGGTLTYGLVSVECCVSGDFYQGYPYLTEIEERRTCSCICSVEDNRFHPPCNQVAELLPSFRHSQAHQQLSSVVVTATPEGELSITGHQPASLQVPNAAKITVDDGSQPEDVMRSVTAGRAPPLQVSGWHSQTTKEAVVFLHGYNIPIDWALKKYAQMLTGAGYPPYIKPFIFSWPTGKLMFYVKACEMCEDPVSAKSLTHFLHNLRSAGFRSIHILSHSMGIRLFLSAFKRQEFQDLFALRKGKGEKKVNQMRLESIIFANPDYSLGSFTRMFDQLSSYCSNITVYSDQGDTALKYSSIYAGEDSLGNVRSPITRIEDGRKVCLDVDVVDTTDLQDNIHSVRHSAFNVNRIILEDMRELIVQKRRAVYRTSRLVKKQGNFFVFMTIPSMVDGTVV